MTTEQQDEIDDRMIETVINHSTEFSLSGAINRETLVTWINNLPEDATIRNDGYSEQKLKASWTTLGKYHPGPDKLWTEALKFECPSCESPIGEYCINLNKRIMKLHGPVQVKNPHPSRIALIPEDLRP